MAEPEIVPLPRTVMLRNRMFAIVEQCVDGTEPFVLLGQMRDGERNHELWRDDGRWLQSGQSHPMDIIGVVTNEGTLAALASAAGQKGPQ